MKHRFLALPALAVLLAAGCAEGPPPVRPPAPAEDRVAATIRRERAYLLNPFDGYGQSVDAVRTERLQRAYEALVTTGAAGPARQTAAELLAQAPGFAPAKVLAAQADFASGDDQGVVVRLLPVGDAQSNYTASQLLLGRAAELAGDVPLAYAAYRAIATRNGKAFERTGNLHAQALKMVGERLHEALAGKREDRLAEAERDMALLNAWAPGELPTLEAARELAQAHGDAKAELDAVKGLAGRIGGDRSLLERRADLELEVGDPGAGLKIIQELADRHPGDPRLAEKLRAAKYRWRLSLLPPDVRELGDKPELSRADLAVLLYWLVPQVRVAKAVAGRIATDILDQPHRDEIVHVLNLGLMDVDVNLHRFSPASPMRRGAALRTLGRLLSGFGDQVGCVEVAGGQAAGPCRLATECGLIAAEDACAAGDPLSGTDAVEWIGRVVALLGGR